MNLRKLAAILFVALLGIYFHFTGNREFELEMDGALRGWPLAWHALRGATPALAPGALGVTLLAAAGRLASLRRNARLKPRSTLQSATGIRARRLVQMTMGMAAGSFNTREFFHGRPREVVRAVRWTFLALVFPVPAVLLLLGEAAAAFLVQYAGLLAERWYFFAEAFDDVADVVRSPSPSWQPLPPWRVRGSNGERPTPATSPSGRSAATRSLITRGGRR